MAALLCSVALSRKRNPKCSAQAESSVTWSISLSVASRNPTHPKLNNSTLKIDVWKTICFPAGSLCNFSGANNVELQVGIFVVSSFLAGDFGESESGHVESQGATWKIPPFRRVLCPVHWDELKPTWDEYTTRKGSMAIARPISLGTLLIHLLGGAHTIHTKIWIFFLGGEENSSRYHQQPTIKKIRKSSAIPTSGFPLLFHLHPLFPQRLAHPQRPVIKATTWQCHWDDHLNEVKQNSPTKNRTNFNVRFVLIGEVAFCNWLDVQLVQKSCVYIYIYIN